MNIVFNFILICIFCFHYEKSSAENILNEDAAETTVELPLDIVDSVGTQLTRRSRQLFFQPSYVVVQNLQFPISANCIDNHGHPGLCREIGTCQGSQRTPPQLYYLPSAATKQAIEGYCFYYDQFGVGRNGICCGLPALAGPSRPNSTFIDTSIDNALPDADTDTDTETINSSKTATTTTPVMSHETEYNMQHVDDINSQWLYSGVRQWPFGPTQFGLQWPPPIPTHPASIGRWPPPIPTHPPNHQYPTHPPSRPAPITTQRTSTTTTTTTTTRRPIAAYPAYPGYPFPTYRPPIAITTTIRPITTSSTTTVSNDVSDTGLDANGLPLKCGIKNPVSPDQERIVGGNNASPHEFPWIAVLFKSGKQFCGGSLITQNHILSAAHCVARMTPWDVAALTAHLGDYNIRTDFEVKHVSRRIKRLVRHKGFDFSTLHNDISILTLSEPVKFSYEIQPICLPTSHAEITRSYSGFTATVVGWGSLRENGPQPSILQKVDIPVWSNSECQRKYGGAAPAGIISSMLCAGQAAKDSCSGDSGGPLIINDGGRYTQVGIVSWGIGCGKGQYPGVYTRVTSLLPWIYKNIK